MSHLCPTCRQELPPRPDLIISLDENVACARGRFVKLQPDQTILAVSLLGAWPGVLRFEDAYDALWGKNRINAPVDQNGILRTQIFRLRKLLVPLGYGIVPVWATGHRLVDQTIQAPVHINSSAMVGA